MCSWEQRGSWLGGNSQPWISRAPTRRDYRLLSAAHALFELCKQNIDDVGQWRARVSVKLVGVWIIDDAAVSAVLMASSLLSVV